MVKKISFIIIMSFALTGCSVFSKEEETEQVDAYEELLSGDTSDLGADVGINPLGEETQAVDPLTGETLSFNELADVEDGTIQQPQNNSYILPPYAVGSVTLVDNPQTVQDIRYNFMIRGKLEPVWKIGNFSLEGQQQTTDSKGNSTIGETTGKDAKKAITEASKNAVILVHYASMDAAEGQNSYYNFNLLVSDPSKESTETALAQETQGAVGGATVKLFIIGDGTPCYTIVDGKKCVRICTENGLPRSNEDSSALTTEGSMQYMADDTRFEVEDLYDLDRLNAGQQTVVGHIFREIKEQQ